MGLAKNSKITEKGDSFLIQDLIFMKKLVLDLSLYFEVYGGWMIWCGCVFDATGGVTGGGWGDRNGGVFKTT